MEIMGKILREAYYHTDKYYINDYLINNIEVN